MPLPYPEQIVRRNRAEDVEHKITPEDAIVPPPVAPVDLPQRQVFICRRHGAVFAGRGRRGIKQLTPGLGEIRRKIFLAALPPRRIEDSRLPVVTLHRSSMKRGSAKSLPRSR